MTELNREYFDKQLGKLATKQDLKGLATKDDLKGLATKEDLKIKSLIWPVWLLGGLMRYKKNLILGPKLINSKLK